MTDHPLEMEVKFYLGNPRVFEENVRAAGASLVQPRTFEVNYRFDTKDKKLTSSRQVLRLRKDSKITLTYKGSADKNALVSIRPEIEVEIENFDSMNEILAALGFEVSVIYEKWRTVYLLDGCEVTLDEMPYGQFTEIEGPDPLTIEKVAKRLRLDWNLRIKKSYLSLFEALKDLKGLTICDLTFEAFAGMDVHADELNLSPADQGLH
jgi:adenylate cyclase, class 2